MFHNVKTKWHSGFAGWAWNNRMKRKIKVLVDILMLLLLFAVMSYHKTGEQAHKCLGIGIFLLFILHNVLNWTWFKNLLQGKYTAIRAVHTAMNVLLILDMIALAVSGFLLSSLALRLQIHAGLFSRKLHMLSAAWGYVLIAAHMGLHWGMVTGKWKGAGKRIFPVWVSRLLALLVVVYGLYAAATRQFYLKMFWMVDYAFYDYEEPVIWFAFDYICVLIGFAYISRCTIQLLKKHKGVKTCCKLPGDLFSTISKII